MIPVPTIGHSFPVCWIGGKPDGRRLSSLGRTNSEEPAWAAPVSDTDGAFCPRNWRRFSAQAFRHSDSASFCSYVTERQSASFAARGSEVTLPEGVAFVCPSSPRSLIAQAATTRTTRRTAAKAGIRSSVFVIISETSARLWVDSRLASGSAVIAPCPGPGQPHAARTQGSARVHGLRRQP